MRSHLERNDPPRVVPRRQWIAIGPDQRADCRHQRSLRPAFGRVTLRGHQAHARVTFLNAGAAENASLLSAGRAGTSLIPPERPRRSPAWPRIKSREPPSGRPYQTNRAGHVVAFGEHGEVWRTCNQSACVGQVGVMTSQPEGEFLPMLTKEE